MLFWFTNTCVPSCRNDSPNAGIQDAPDVDTCLPLVEDRWFKADYQALPPEADGAAASNWICDPIGLP